MFLKDSTYSFAYNLIRTVRTGQGIPQAEVASGVGLSQPALAQYEGKQHRSTLSKENIKKMAPLINLDPEYFDKKSPNPFKQAHQSKPIRFFLEEDHSGNINYDSLRIIAESNLKTDVVFLKIPESAAASSKRILQQTNKGRTICAFAMRDTKDNIFLFRKKRNYSFFEETDLKETLKSLTREVTMQSHSDNRGHFFPNSAEISPELFNQIITDSGVKTDSLLSFFPKIERRESVDFIEGLVDYIWSHPSLTENINRKKAMMSAIESIGERYYLDVMPDLLDKVIQILNGYAEVRIKNLISRQY